MPIVRISEDESWDVALLVVSNFSRVSLLGGLTVSSGNVWDVALRACRKGLDGPRATGAVFIRFSASGGGGRKA